jgi:RNA polymerase sigma-70 factor (ECF subfamily)
MALDLGARDCQRRVTCGPMTMSVEVMLMHPRSGGPVLSRQQLDVLLNDISRGDEVAFEQLYRATSAKLYGIVLRIVRRREVADELLQDIYLRVWKHAGRFDASRSSPITWMATIARNCALDEVKRSALPLSEDDFELIEPAGEDNPADQYERAENARRLQLSLGRLGPEKSALIVQAYCYGMSRKDIAKRTGQSVSTVKTWLRRSLAELRSYLEEEEGDDLLAKGSAIRDLRGPDQSTRQAQGAGDHRHSPAAAARAVGARSR